MKKIAIIGGGASGMIAGIEASSLGAEVTIYEKGARVGKKLLATGNGRCNISNRFCNKDRYHGENVDFINTAMGKYGTESTEKFFAKMGIPFTELEDGKLYPRSLQASAVLDILRLRLSELQVKTVCDCEIIDICKKENIFLLSSKDNEFYADSVILSAGGEASSNLGGTDGGYELLKKLGHTITKRLPSIVQLKTDISEIKAVAGIKIDAKVTLLADKKEVISQFGEVLFTDYGVSGPPVLQISGMASRLLEKDKKVVISLDLISDMEEKELFFFLKNRAYTNPDRTLEDFLTGFIPKRIGQSALKSINLSPLSKRAYELDDNDLKVLAKKLKDWKLEIYDTNGFKNAQVTIGGAKTDEFNPDTMESKKVSGLFACGEVLDIDGDCGGFNLQWAWASGRLAGENAVK